ncbi:8-amino-7-oxononanoate synthase [Acetobacteraceae bacterium]|nr:8-amino-7-oxononanoate synthase [Acetobacteraceae bacterium]
MPSVKLSDMNFLNQALEAALTKRQETGLFRKIPEPLETGYIDLASNDYLNLSKHPFLKQSSIEWTQKLGVGATGSRLISGSFLGYSEVEKAFAAFKKTESALLFNSGWQANASILPALNELSRQIFSAPALFFMDKLCHASMIQGANASQAGHAKAKILRFRHNDTDHLQSLLEREKETKGLKFILTESIFSMDGDRANLKALFELKTHYQAILYIDEAHATGLFGANGAGLANPEEVELILSTGSKAMGSAGAFLCSSQKMRKFLINMASGFIYSTSLPPAILGSLQAATALLPNLAKERKHLLFLAQKFRNQLAEKGWNYLTSESQIIPVLIKDPEKALRLRDKLNKAGFRCGAIRPPTVPPHTARLRFTMNTALEEQDIENVIKVLGTP